jgi:hypothetical protein
MGHMRARVGDQRLGVIHHGSRYVFGYAATFYGVWDESAPGEPVERFPATLAGRQDAWRRYQELEPAAADIDATAVGFAPPPAAEQGRSRRAWIVTSVLVGVVVIAAVAVLASRSGTKTAGGAGGVATGAGHQASVTLSSAGASQTLDQQRFRAIGIGVSLYPEVKATWAGSGTTLLFDINIPQVGDNDTGTQTKNTLVLTSNGTTYRSTAGECTITLKDLSADGISGSFTCTGVPATSGTETSTIDARGTFGASK